MNQPSSSASGGSRLSAADSPYLLQHAGNPVQWWPWCSEAFAHARQRDLPVFVSIGYATCHWCHVLERESFADERCAARLNESFVAIKVDREQRPDVDDLFMSACQIFTQATEGRASGGWPLSAFVDPGTGFPFFVGTYFPPEPAWGRASFIQLLEGLSAAWKDRRPALLEQSKRIANAVIDAVAVDHPPKKIRRDCAERAARKLMQVFDEANGGFGDAPKFPQPSYLTLMLAAGGEAGAAIVRTTLAKMALGGLFDHVAGGFHRYCVDSAWQVPHFEKMLYDNALLVPLYAQCSARTGDRFLAHVCERTLAFIDRELAIDSGGFYCALDADVNHREGAGHVWSAREVSEALAQAGFSTQDAASFADATGLSSDPNFRDPHHPADPPAWVLQMRNAADALDPSIERALRALHDVRRAREQPIRDEKVLLCWNGMMIEAFAVAGEALHNSTWTARAVTAAEWVFAHLQTTAGWQRCWFHGRASIGATLEDLASLGNACISLARATGEMLWFERADELFQQARAEFFDPSSGRWHDCRAGETTLFVRPRSLQDGATPSGTTSIVRLMIALATPGDALATCADLARTLEGIGQSISEQPLSMSAMLSLLADARALAPCAFEESD